MRYDCFRSRAKQSHARAPLKSKNVAKSYARLLDRTFWQTLMWHRALSAGCLVAPCTVGRCLTSPSEAHRKSFLGQAAACRNVCGRGPWAKRRGRLRTGHREAAAGLPAAEEGLRAGPVGV